MASDAALGAAAAGGAGAGFGLLLLWINTYPFIDEGQPARRPPSDRPVSIHPRGGTTDRGRTSLKRFPTDPRAKERRPVVLSKRARRVIPVSPKVLD